MKSQTKKKKKYNTIIINEFEKMKKKLYSENDLFRFRAYDNAIQIIKDNFSNTIITSGEQLRPYKGIGKKIQDKIDEIIEFGYLKDNKQNKKNIHQTISKVYGIGPSVAKKLVETKKIKSIQDLIRRKNELQENGKPLLNNKMKLGLKYYDIELKRIPRSEMIKHETFLLNEFNHLFPKDILQMVGSYRRKKKDSGDIDVLISSDTSILKSFIHHLRKINYLIDDFALGNKKYLGICKLDNGEPRRIDILYTSPKEFPFALLYFTGSDRFNKGMRLYAKQLGYRLSEHGIVDKTNIFHSFEKEEDIFRFLDIQYIKPEDRETFPSKKIDYNI